MHLTGLPVPGPLRIRQQARGLGSGVLTQTRDIWDDADHLVAHAVQLAVLPKQRLSTGWTLIERRRDHSR
jgi:hypothetical protein